MSLFCLAESDIDYISPNDFVPPPIEGEKNGNSANHDVDPYDRIVRGSLKMLDKQKVRKSFLFCELNILFS